MSSGSFVTDSHKFVKMPTRFQLLDIRIIILFQGHTRYGMTTLTHLEVVLRRASIGVSNLLGSPYTRPAPKSFQLPHLSSARPRSASGGGWTSMRRCQPGMQRSVPGPGYQMVQILINPL
ncbi:hypothetical protein AAFF_G00053330 [Aldrovandia affinis]|uniref:Uncharacterized protein n=1 Tax=Aldrovandia affinis TaxID=143900 RepID=A0AAD7WZA9_9TELE|nr:hypothetical protein AAFF_G00053330 [Aldrovandia affinis]